MIKRAEAPRFCAKYSNMLLVSGSIIIPPRSERTSHPMKLNSKARLKRTTNDDSSNNTSKQTNNSVVLYFQARIDFQKIGRIILATLTIFNSLFGLLFFNGSYKTEMQKSQFPAPTIQTTKPADNSDGSRRVTKPNPRKRRTRVKQCF